MNKGCASMKDRQAGPAPSLSDLVDWDDAPAWAGQAVQKRDSAMGLRDEVYFPIFFRAAEHDEAGMRFHKYAPLARDWETALQRPHTHKSPQCWGESVLSRFGVNEQTKRDNKRLRDSLDRFSIANGGPWITAPSPQPPDHRPSWDEYFMQAAFLASTRSTCLRRKVGAVAVRDRRILATGYNGAPSGLPHCLDAGCIRKTQNIPSGQRHELCRGLHAEQNVIIQAAVHGISLVGSELYLTTTPCSICAKMLINCRVWRIHVPDQQDYDDPMAKDMLCTAGIEIHRLQAEPGCRLF